MALFRDAAEMARGRTAAIFLSASVALVPAYLLGGALVFLATRHAGAQLGSATRVEALAEKGRDLPSDAPGDKRRDILLQAREPGEPRPTTATLAVVAGVLFAALVMIAGLFIAQAPLLALAAGARGTSDAWAALAARLDRVVATTGAALALIGLGLAAGILPGLFAALAFSLAVPTAVAEGASSFFALHRSWQLMKRAWPAQLGLVLLAALPAVLLTQALGRLLPPGAVVREALVDTVAVALVLPLPLFASVVLYLRTRAAVEGKPVEELRQYIRRTSAPG